MKAPKKFGQTKKWTVVKWNISSIIYKLYPTTIQYKAFTATAVHQPFSYALHEAIQARSCSSSLVKVCTIGIG